MTHIFIALEVVQKGGALVYLIVSLHCRLGFGLRQPRRLICANVLEHLAHAAWVRSGVHVNDVGLCTDALRDGKR
jgi:hypothetical protein